MTEGGGFVLGRLPETPDELYHLVKGLWGVTIPRHKVCEEHCAPFDAFSDAYFRVNTLEPDSAVQSIALWHGSRGLSGKSYMLSILGLTIAFLRGSDVNLLGGSYAQSQNIHEHMRMALESKNSPRYMLEEEGATKITLSNKARIRPLTASQNTVRGPHPATLLCDEIDEMDLPILDAALGQPLPQKNYLGELIKPYTVMCSTWQNPQGTFTEIMRRAEEKNIPIYAWCYQDTANPIDGWLSQEAIEEKKTSIPKEMWRTEYELGEPSIGNRAFDTEAVEAMFDHPLEPLKEKVAKDYEEYILAEPEHQGQYFIGADWAKEQDFTVISVLRADRQESHGIELVYWARLNRRPYPMMIKMFNDAMAKYNAQGEYDRTGLGNVVTDYLDYRAHGFMMIGEKRSSMLSEFVNAVEQHKFIFPKIKTAYLALKYCQVGDLYSGALSIYHLPDEVCSLALAYYRYARSAPSVAPITIKKGEDTNRYERMFRTPPDRNMEHEQLEVYQPPEENQDVGGLSLTV